MKLFISYARVDVGLVTQIVEILRSGGHDPWFDHRLLPGQDWKQELHNAIEVCEAFVYMLTPESVASEWCQWEFADAVKMQKPILPILLQKNTEIPEALSRFHYADLSTGITLHNVAQLMGGITNILITQPIPEISDVPENPDGVPAQVEVLADRQVLGSGSSQSTPFDNKVGVWLWKADSLSQDSIEEVAQSLKRAAPNITDIFVKTNDCTSYSGAQWQGHWDSKRELAINDTSDIDQWVQVLGRHGMNFHAWCVVRGLDVTGETNLIARACLRPGVRSMILSVEPNVFGLVGRDVVHLYMTRIRRQIPGTFHIGILVDPRKHHYTSIYPEEWRAFVNSVHPQINWETFQYTPHEALSEVYEVWGDYGRPIVPVLQGDAKLSDMRIASDLAVNRYQASGLSWWRLDLIGTEQFQAINQLAAISYSYSKVSSMPEQFGKQLVVRPTDQGFAKGSYLGQDEFLSFKDDSGWTVYYKQTAPTQSAVWVQWLPNLPKSGQYEVSVFVPGQHATTQRARYKVHGVKNVHQPVDIEVDQSLFKNQWVSLGVFEFDKGAINAGSIFANDLTYESGREITFGAMRWREVVEAFG